LQNCDHQLEKKMQRISFLAGHYFFIQRQKVAKAHDLTVLSIPRILLGKSRQLEIYTGKFGRLAGRQLETEMHKIDLAGQKATLSDPENILKKGYSITTCHGKLVKDLTLLKKEDSIKTRFFKGSVVSKIIEINNSGKNGN
jgi:exodeoxyribonuclease VII large subunit